MNEFYVYQLRRADRPEPFYIGKGKGDRAKQYFFSGDDDSHKRRTILKAEREGVEVLIEYLFEGLDEEEALRREVWAIKIWGRTDKEEGPLTNKTDGGEGRSGALVDPRPEERKLLVSSKQKGIPKSESTKAKMSAARLGKPSVNKGVPMSKEAREKMSKAKMGNVPHNAGKPMSEEQKEKLRSSSAKSAYYSPLTSCLNCRKQFKGPSFFAHARGCRP